MVWENRPELRKPSPNPPRTSRGLTLLELIIAFVILEIALTVFAQLFMGGLDLARKARSADMAQILAQARMEELMRTVSTNAHLKFSSGGPGTSKLLNDVPGTFDDLAYGHSQNVEPFMWLAEAAPSPNNPKLVNVSLHVYVVTKRTKPQGSSLPAQDFYVSDDRKGFTLMHTLSDGSIEVIVGKERLRVTSAVALPYEAKS